MPANMQQGSHLKNNIDFFIKKSLLLSDGDSWWSKLDDVPELWNTNVANMLLEERPIIAINGISLHSTRDAEREAKRQAEAIEESYHYVILFGSGLGYLVRELLKKPATNSILLIEPDLEVLFYFLSIIPWHEVLKKKDLFLFHVDEPSIAEMDPVLKFVQGKNLESVLMYPFRPAVRARPEYYEPVIERTRNVLEKRGINQATLIRFQSLWNKNIALNSSATALGAGILQFTDLLKDIPVVIAGAGPSLIDSISILKKDRKKFALLCADTALVPLLKKKIFPDLVFSADPQWHNHYFVYHENAGKPVWVLDPVVCHAIPHVLAVMQGECIWWDNPFFLYQLIERVCGKKGEISHGGSVSTNAFDFALKAGATEIILVGQDLSFSGKAAHIKGSALEQLVYYGQNRFKNFESHNHMQLTSLPKLEIDSSTTGKVYTNAKMKVFIDWFENQARILQYREEKVTLYNATVTGAKVAGFLKIDFETHFSGKPDVKLRIKSEAIAKEKFLDQKKVLLSSMDKFLKQVNLLKNLYTANLALANSLANQKPGSNFEKSLKIMSDKDKQAGRYKEANSMVALGAQEIILGITEHSQGNDAIQNSIALYSRLAESSSRLIYTLHKMVQILS